MEWIKLDTGLFSDEKIQLLRSHSNGDELVAIWVQLLCLAGKLDNDGVFMLTETKPYQPAQIATVCGRSAQRFKAALSVYEDLGMVSLENGCVTICNWLKYQSMSEKRNAYKEANKQRQKRYRERQRNISAGVTPSVSNGVTERYGNASECVTPSVSNGEITHTEKEEEKEIEKEYIKGEGDIYINRLPTPDSINAYVTNVMPMSPTYMQELEDFTKQLPEDVIRWCIDQSVEARSWKYCRKVIMRCIECGYTTLGEVLAAEKKRDERKRAAAASTDHGYQEHEYTEDDFSDMFLKPE